MTGIEHHAYTERNTRGNGTRAICVCGWHSGWGTNASAEKYARRHQERPDLNPVYPPTGTVYESDDFVSLGGFGRFYVGPENQPRGDR
jgi:hypothetical protein